MLDLIRDARPRAILGTAFVNVGVVAIGSLGGLFLARFLGPTYRGELTIILQWPITVASLAGFGIVQSTCFWVSRLPEKAAQISSTAAVAGFSTGALVAVLAPFVAARIARNTDVAVLLTLCFALAPVYIAARVLMGCLQATNIKHWNIARGVQPCTYLAGVIGLWVFGLLTLFTAVAAFAASLLVETLAAFLITRATVGSYRRVQTQLLRPLYSFGLKVWLSTVPQTINVSVDQLVLSVMPSIVAAQLGNYSVAVSLSWLALPASVAFGSVAFPRIAGTRNEVDIRRIEYVSLTGAGLAAAITIGGVSLLAPALVPKIFGSGYHDAIVALWLLAPGTVVLALNRVLGDLLQGRGHPLALSVAEAIGSGVTVVLLITLIPTFGIRGAAIASSVSYGVICAALILIMARLRRQRARLQIAPTEQAVARS